jgi:hypothetical protein
MRIKSHQRPIASILKVLTKFFEKRFQTSITTM